MDPESEPSGETRSLAGRRLLLVLGSYRSKRHLFERARRWGVRLVVLDGPDHWMRNYVGPGELIDEHLAVDLRPFPTFAERSLEAITRSGLTFDGIGAVDEFAGGFAARIAESLGLPFHAIEAADRARDKHRVREICAEARIAGPAVCRIESPADLPRASALTGFPAVLKPVSGVGSVQTYRVSDPVELAGRYEDVLADVLKARARDAASLSSDRDWFDLMWAGPPDLVLESWIEGPKYDVDLLLEGGRLIYGHATDDLQPCGLRDVRRVAPSGLEERVEASLIDHAAACVCAIGFNRGAFNVEVKLTSDGPRMIEVNGRLGGYSTTDIHEQVWGVDLVEQWLRSSLGLPLRVREKAPSIFVAESLLPSPRSGLVQADGFLEALATVPSVAAFRQWAFAGDAVAGVETGAPDWLGAVLCRGRTRAEALAHLDRLVSGLEFPVRAPGETA